MRISTHKVEKVIKKNRNRVNDSGILIARCYLELSRFLDNEKNPYTRSARPPASVSTSLAMLLESGAWWLYSIELVARPLVMVRRAVT